LVSTLFGADAAGVLPVDVHHDVVSHRDDNTSSVLRKYEEDTGHDRRRWLQSGVETKKGPFPVRKAAPMKCVVFYCGEHPPGIALGSVVRLIIAPNTA
jgi:hypothetical protein